MKNHSRHIFTHSETINKFSKPRKERMTSPFKTLFYVEIKTASPSVTIYLALNLTSTTQTQMTVRSSIFSLYRRCLRAARTKPAATRPNFERVIRNEFRKNASAVSRRDFGTIEFMLRMGERKLSTYSPASVRDIH